MMGETEIIVTLIIAIIIWALILKGIIKSSIKSVINLLILIAKKQGASEDELFLATKSQDEIYARQRKIKMMQKKEMQKKK